MGNTCTKELSSISALINKAGGDANAARYKKTELNSLSTGLHSSESTTVKESQVKYAILHPQIRDLLLRLSYDEIQIILNIFRLKVRQSRSGSTLPPSANAFISPRSDAGDPNHLSISSALYPWKRLSLSKKNLYDILPSFHPSSLHQTWLILQQDFTFPKNNATHFIEQSIKDGLLINADNILKMFLFSDYKNGISSQSEDKDFPKDIIFQDFCTISSILLHGSKEELFTLLFLLFSEEMIIPNTTNKANNPNKRSQQNIQRGLSSNHPSQGTIEDDHGFVAPSKSHSIDPIISPSSSGGVSSHKSNSSLHSSSPPKQHEVESSPVHENSAAEDIPPLQRTLSEPTSKKLVLTEKRLLELYVFVAMMLYHEPSLSVKQRAAVRQSSDFMKLITSLRELLSQHNGKHVEQLLNNSTNTAHNSYYTLSAFLSGIFPQNHPGSSTTNSTIHGTGGNLLANLNVPRVLASGIYHPIFYDFIPNPYEILKKVFDTYSSASSISALQKSLKSYSGLFHAGNGAAGHQEDRQKELAQQSYEIFLIESGWWTEFCDKMEVTPVYSDVVPYLVIDIHVTSKPKQHNHTKQHTPNSSPRANHTPSHTSNSTTTAFSSSKYELFDIFCAGIGDLEELAEEGDHHRSNMGEEVVISSVVHAMSLSLLNNRQLLKETLPAQFEYLPPDHLTPLITPFSSSNGVASDGKQYVALPFEIGKALYEAFDVSATTFSADVFRRSLRFVHNTASSEYVAYLANHKDSLTSAIHHFVNNFHIPFTIFIDVYSYYSLPIYTASSLGLATIEPIIDEFYYYNTKETMTIKQWLIQNLQQYGRLSIDFGHSEPLERSFRVWALVGITPPPVGTIANTTTTSGGGISEDIAYPNRKIRLPFNQSYEWVLITENDHDYQLECHGNLWNLFPWTTTESQQSNNKHTVTRRSTGKVDNNVGNLSAYTGKKDFAIALMIENVTEEGQFPSEHILTSELWKNIRILSQKEEQEEEHQDEPRNSDENGHIMSNVLRIGLLVDIFNPIQQRWQVGEVINIMKMDYFNDLSNAKRKITLSIRCRFSDSVDENDAVVFELPLESNHLLVHGTITDLISVQSLPSLLMEDQLRVNAVEIVKKSHVFHQIIQQSSTHLQRSETASSLPQTQNNNPAANGNNNALNSILVTPAKGRNSSVVPITVAFTPEPATTSSSIHHDDSHKYSTPVKGKPSGHFLGNGLEDILSSVTIEEIERMDWKILQYIAEEDDSFKLYYTFYLSEDYYQQEIKNFKELTMYVSNRNHPAVIRQHRSLQQQNGAPFLPNRSLQGLFYFPGHGGMNLISSDNNENRNSLNNTTNTTTTDLASPGKQLLSKWEKLFPNGSGNGTNGSGNSNGNTNSVSTQATNHAAENSNGRKGRTVNSANNRSNYSVTSATGTAINSNNSSMEKIPSHNNNGTNAVVPLTTTSVHQPTVAAPPSLQPPVVSGGGSGGGTSTSITRMGIIGLNNLGNTCFLSSALQCLLRTPIFIPYFLSYQYKFDINDRSKFGTNGKLTEEFAEFVRTVYNPYIGSNNGVTNLNNKERNSNSNFFGTGDGKQQFYYFGRNKANNNANPSAGNTNGNSNGGSLNNSAHNNGHNNSSTRLRGSNGSVNTGALTTATTNHPSTPTGLQQTSIYSRVTISPTTFYKLFQGHKTQFSGADQQDAQEFLSELLDTFHEDLKNNLLDNHNQAVANTSSSSAGVLTSANSSLLRNVIYSNSNRRSLIRLSMDHQSSLTGSQLLVGNSSANAAGKINNAVNAGIAAAVREIIFNGDKAWDEYAKRNDSIVTNVFQGQLCTHVSCESCGKANTRFEPFTTLSLPIPKAVINNSTLSLNGHSNHEVYTVIIKFYRKLPRWSSYWRLRHYLITTIGPSSSSALSIEDIDTLMRKSILIELLKQRKETKRFVIKCTKNMTIETLKVKCIDYLQTIYSKKRSSPKATDYSQKTFQQVFNGGKAAATSSSQLERVESIEEADEQQQSQQRRNGSTGGELPFPDELQQELKIANLTMIDISSDEKYRIRKIVENKEYLSAVIDENSNNSNECELLLIENNKDINFISSLPGNKLNVNPDSFLRHHNQILSSVLSTPLTRDILVNKKAEDWDHLLTRLFFGFVEEEEYYENNFYHHLLLHTYPPLGITPSSQALMSRSSGSLGGTGILPTSTGLPAEKVICDLDYRYSNQHASATTPSNSSTRERARSSSSASNSSQSHHQTFTKPFPKNMADLQLYDRVDALDHKDQWYSGSVVEILTFPGVVIDVPTVATPSSHSKKNKSGSSSSSKDRPPLSSSNSGRQDSLRHHQNNEQQQQQQRQKPDEIFIRVHFDNYSFVWDEWYDLSEFQQGCITSIYTKANRKLKIYDIQIVQRKLVYTVSPSNKAGSGNNNLGVYGSLDLTKIELIEQPFILQVESYRTISHLYSQIVEQMSRYLPVEYVESLIFDQTSSSSSSQSFETIKLPFEVRMLNIQNLYASPNQPLNYSTCYISTEKTDRSRERFERHKQWEGLNLPRYDRDRPVSNVYHPKLILTVDWEYILLPPNSTSSPTSSQPNTARASPNPSNTPALIILADYVSYINSLPPQQPPQLQHSPSVEERGRASSTASVNSSSGGGGKGNNTSQVTTTAAVRCSVIQMLPDARYEDDASFTEYDKLNNYQYSMTSTTSITSNHHQNQVNGSNTGGNDGSNITSGGSTSYPWNFDATKGHRNADRKVYHLATSGVSPSSPNGNSNNSKDPRPGLTIENVLSNFTAKEEIQDYYCEHCKELKKGIMYSSIHKSPDILILHLKRLIMNSTGGAKIRTLVKFPLQNLNISQFMTQSMALKSSRPRSNSAAVDPTLMTDKNYGGGGGGSLSGNEAELAEVEQFMTSGDGIEGVENNYDLFGVVNHLGGMFGGHYTAYAQCEDLHYTSNNTTPAPPSTSHTSNEGERHIYTTASELKSILYDHSEVNLKDYSLSPGTINPTSFLPTPPHTTAYLNNLAQQQTSSLRIGQHLQPQASLETTYRWYKFDDDYAIELTSQYAPIEPTIVSESAYLLFYKKKQLSRESILRYT